MWNELHASVKSVQDTKEEIDKRLKRQKQKDEEERRFCIGKTSRLIEL